MASIVELNTNPLRDAMEDIFVVRRCNKTIIHGRRAGEHDHLPPEAAVWYRIADIRTQGFIGDGYEVEEDAASVCRQLNVKSQVTARQS